MPAMFGGEEDERVRARSAEAWVRFNWLRVLDRRDQREREA